MKYDKKKDQFTFLIFLYMKIGDAFTFIKLFLLQHFSNNNI
jgi:hypothetical protein